MPQKQIRERGGHERKRHVCTGHIFLVARDANSRKLVFKSLIKLTYELMWRIKTTANKEKLNGQTGNKIRTRWCGCGGWHVRFKQGPNSKTTRRRPSNKVLHYTLNYEMSLLISGIYLFISLWVVEIPSAGIIMKLLTTLHRKAATSVWIGPETTVVEYSRGLVRMSFHGNGAKGRCTTHCHH